MPATVYIYVPLHCFCVLHVMVYHLSTGLLELEQDNQSDVFLSLFLSFLYCTHMDPLGRESRMDQYRGKSKENIQIKESKE